MHRLIFKSGAYRILEESDSVATADDLKGDTYCPVANPDMDPVRLKQGEEAFARRVEREGVYGYVLERWNPAVGAGWEHVDSCWGFVGGYIAGTEYEHYIVAELKRQIPAQLQEA